MRSYPYLALLFLIAPISPASADDCVREHVNFVFGMDTQQHITVKSGKLCPMGIGVTGGGLTDMHVQQAAQHGIVGLAGRYRYGYQSKPGYVGRDYFVIQVSGEVMGNRNVHNGTSNFVINVDVVP